jgi:hypothetical protein
LISTVDAFRGQPRVIKLLEAYLQAGKLAGTLLLLGQRGLGKTSLATIIARALTCERNREQRKFWFCGECYACRSIAAGEQPEFVLVKPAGKDISVKQIEQDYDGFRSALLLPTTLSHRVFVIDEAHYLNEETSNQLLKLLEEVPGCTVFILVTDRPNLLLPTIHSRGQKIALSPVPEEELAGYVERDADAVDSKSALEAACMSGGRYVDAMQLVQSDTWRKAVKRLASTLLAGSGLAQAVEPLWEYENEALWHKELADTGLEESKALKLVSTVRKNELKRQALITAYDRAALWALRYRKLPAGFFEAFTLLKARINQNVDMHLAQAAFEIQLASL